MAREYARLEEGEGGSSGWPSRHELAELMQDEGDDMLTALTKGEGVPRLVAMLGSSESRGIVGGAEDLERRKREFGANTFETKKLKSYLELVWDGLHDMTIISAPCRNRSHLCLPQTM